MHRSVLLLLSVTCTGALAEERARDPFVIPRPEFYRIAEEHPSPSPNLFRLIGHDFKHLVTTKENFIILGVGLGAAWGASHFDHDVATSGLNSELSGGGSLDHVFESGEIAGASHTQLGVAMATYGVGKLFKSDGVSELGRDLLRAQIVAGTVTFALKVSVGRERPDGSSNTSFPSGHTSASFATASVLQRRYGWRAGVPAYAFAGYVAGSRLNEGRHYLSDVIFGATIGIASGRTVTLEVAKQRFAVGPTFGADGAVGVQFTWLGPGGDVW